MKLGNADQKKKTASESSMIGQYARKSVHTLHIKTSGDTPRQIWPGVHSTAFWASFLVRILKELSYLLRGPAEP